MPFDLQLANYEQRDFDLDVAVTAAAFGRVSDEEYGVYHLAEALLSLRELDRHPYALRSEQFDTLAGVICFAQKRAKDRLPEKFDSGRLLQGLHAALVLTEMLCRSPGERSAFGDETRCALDQILIAHHDMVALSMALDLDRRIKDRRRGLQDCVVIDFQSRRNPPHEWGLYP